jgi:hypothetical protein
MIIPIHPYHFDTTLMQYHGNLKPTCLVHIYSNNNWVIWVDCDISQLYAPFCYSGVEIIYTIEYVLKSWYSLEYLNHSLNIIHTYPTSCPLNLIGLYWTIQINKWVVWVIQYISQIHTQSYVLSYAIW